MSPRSILKQSSSSSANTGSVPSMTAALPYPPPPPQVHFPPTPALTQTCYTHSGSTYDRAPIAVLPNECALPERGCRKYTSTKSSSGRSGESHLPGGSGKHPHPRVADVHADGRIPRAYGPAPAPSYSSSFRTQGPPPLVPDLSSESDESDGVVSPPPELYPSAGAAAHAQPGHRPHPHGYAVHLASPSREQLDKALAFLPHSNESPKPKRENDRRKRSDASRFKSEDASRSFASSALDGCLGGF